MTWATVQKRLRNIEKLKSRGNKTLCYEPLYTMPRMIHEHEKNYLDCYVIVEYE